MFPYGPNWYAGVMGTAIVSVAAMSLPQAFPGRSAVAVVFWALAVLLLVAVSTAAVKHRRLLRPHLLDPVMAHFYGAPAMGLMATGAATMLAGKLVIGASGAFVLDVVLWVLGTVVGLSTAVLVPYTAITRHEQADDSANGTWLMPVVPPMVTAATGALLVPYAPAGQGRATLLLFCYACFGCALLASVLVMGAMWQRLVRHGVGAPASVPTVWIALGFLGQSVTAAHHLAVVAPAAMPEYTAALRAFALVYGVPVWGFAMFWLALAAALVSRQLRLGLPFTLSWWSFTFPLGTVVTGTEALSSLTGLGAFEALAALGLVTLLGAWVTVAVRTVRAQWRRRPAEPQPNRTSYAAGLLSRRKSRQRCHSSSSPIARAAVASSARQVRKPRLGSCSHGTGP